MRVQLADDGPLDNRADPDHLAPGALKVLNGHLHLGRQLGRIRLSGAQDDRDLGCDPADGAQQVHDALLARDPANEKHVRLARVDAVALESIGSVVRPIEVRIDAVLNDVNALGRDVEEAQDILAGLAADGDDRVGHLERRALDQAARS